MEYQWGGCGRVLVRLAAQPLDTRRRGGDALYDFIRAAADWPHLLRPGQTFSVEVGYCCCCYRCMPALPPRALAFTKLCRTVLLSCRFPAHPSEFKTCRGRVFTEPPSC